MKYIRKIWSRILISIIIGSMGSEFSAIMTDGKAQLPVFFLAFFAFLLFTGIYYYDIYKYYWFEDEKPKQESK